MTPRLTTDYAQNYCNRTLFVKVIVENVVTCFYGTQCVCSFSTLMLLVGCLWPVKTVARITYTVLETLNHAQSIWTLSLCTEISYTLYCYCQLLLQHLKSRLV